MSGQPEAITEVELDWVLRYHDSGLTAQGLIREIKNHCREPEYEPGGVYQDANGAPWVYSPRRDATAPWLKPGGEGSWSTPTPKRPLRRLVPLPAREDLLTALEESIVLEHGYEGQASRVLALLEGREASDG